MYEDDYSDFFNEIDSLEIPKNTIKSEIYFNIIDSLDSELKNVIKSKNLLNCMRQMIKILGICRLYIRKQVNYLNN